MQPSLEIITTIVQGGSICLEELTGKPVWEGKNSQAENQTNGFITWGLLDTDVKQGLFRKRSSAFTPYDPLPKQNSNIKEDELSFESQFQSLSEQHETKKVRRQKRDKREQSRLQTKNLNRYFRSKINEMLRNIKMSAQSEEEQQKADEILQRLNESNKIMFSEIREVIKDQWLQKKLLRCSGSLMRYIHGGKMGMQSKLIMLKYFNKILKAIRNPDNFTCWK